MFSHTAGRGKKVPAVPALTDKRHDAGPQEKHVPSVAGPPPVQAYIKDVVANAQMKGVPVAPLQTVLRSPIEAGIYEEEIPGRLLAAAGQLGELRTRLASCRLCGLRVEEASAQALACGRCRQS
jgi:hypothetical protein